jgi:hypothetical protein
MAGWDGDREDQEFEDGKELEGPELGGPELDEEEAPFEAGDESAEPESARLDLDDEERLPWLESVDDDEDDEGSDTGRLVLLLVAGLVVLAAMVGGIWWATHREPATELQADGSVVPAPATPYKEAPQDPGGKTFAGTGDTSYAVSEGKTITPRLEGEPAPKPSVELAAKSAAGPAPASSPAPSGVGVQVGAYTSQASAEAGWAKLSQQYSSVLSGVKHRVVEGRADIGTVYRLQALAGDSAGADALCGRLKSAGVACQVKK